ncbi:MAG: universal stress protein [Acidimicrobiales bacterium]
MGLIIVGMDESSTAADALRWAVAEGRTRGWTVRAVLAWTFLRQHRVDRTSTHDPEYDDSCAALALQEYVRDAVDAADVAGIELQTICELPAEAMIQASEGASLLVVGSHGYGGISGLIMGSVSQHCLHRATCPVAIVRPSRDHAVQPGKVVVGVDGSETSRRALRWAVEDARARGGWIEVVHSWLLPAAFGFPTIAVPDVAVFEEAAEALLDELLAEVDLSGLSRPVSRILIGGTSTAGLLKDRAADAELLVVGSRGVGGFEGMVIGSVAHNLAHHAPCPLVVLPAS